MNKEQNENIIRIPVKASAVSSASVQMTNRTQVNVVQFTPSNS